MITPENPPLAPNNYRFLNPGEILQPGDRLLFGEEWIPVTSISLGQTVRNYAYYLRRA